MESNEISDREQKIRELTIQDFQGHDEKSWSIIFNPDSPEVPAILQKVEAHLKDPMAPRQGFSLVFNIQLSGSYYFTQGVYILNHPLLGALPLFMVPLGLNPDNRMQYEIIIA